MFGHSIKSVLLILSLISSIHHFASTIEGRSLLTTALTHDKSSSTSFPQEVDKKQEKEMVVRASIGSRPPRCEGMCKSCGHCEAVQVPTISISVFNIEYKPITWKCKCSTSLSNP